MGNNISPNFLEFCIIIIIIIISCFLSILYSQNHNNKKKQGVVCVRVLCVNNLCLIYNLSLSVSHLSFPLSRHHQIQEKHTPFLADSNWGFDLDTEFQNLVV